VGEATGPNTVVTVGVSVIILVGCGTVADIIVGAGGFGLPRMNSDPKAMMTSAQRARQVVIGAWVVRFCLSLRFSLGFSGCIPSILPGSDHDQGSQGGTRTPAL